ncbi:MAG: toxin-antitoxin system [Planctomycetes bacterium]|nr:toxin-antitoxin system [Planctomycetota bacterium]
MAVRIAALAEARERSKAYIATQAIAKYVEAEERYEQERKEDRERWENYVMTGRSIPHDVVDKWLGNLAEGRDVPCPK